MVSDQEPIHPKDFKAWPAIRLPVHCWYRWANDSAKQAKNRNRHFGDRNLPVKAAVNQRKNMLKCSHPIAPIFSKRTAVDIDTEGLCMKVSPKLQKEKQSSVAKQALFRDDLGFLASMDKARVV